MNKNIETYLISQFVDYKGRIHPFVICAISYSPEKPLLIGEFDEQKFMMNNTHKVERAVNIGYAICNPVDEFNEEIGREMAKKRAIENPKQLFTTNPGIINHTMIDGLLQQEANFIKANPGVFIKGYSAAKKKYLSQINCNKKKKYTVSEETLRHIVDLLNNTDDVSVEQIIKQVFD